MASKARAARPAAFDHTTQHRRSLTAKIYVARKELGIEEDDYRQLLFDTTGRMSLTECSDAQLARVVDALKAKGFRPTPKGGSKAARHPMAMKARALWISLHHLGVVHNPSEQALEAFARRQLGCERLVWANQRDAYRLIEALKAMAERGGWRQRDPNSGKALSPRVLQSSLCHVILAKLQAAGAVPDDWWLDVAAQRLCGIETAKEGGFTADDYARLAQALGRKLRELAPATIEGEA